LNAKLSWNTQARATEITSPVGVAAVAWASYDADEVYWLSRIISAESGGEPFKGQIAVGNVVLNRVRSPQYPNTIYGVIFDRKYGTQFTPAAIGTIYNKPTASAVIAAKICLEGYTLSDEILFFYNPRIATTNWIDRARPYAFTIGDHKFYK
jgi:N-acetylmuramoyl-L-alanine amidase